jgi:hypothetical protein
MTSKEDYNDAMDYIAELLKFSFSGQSRLRVIKNRVAYLEGKVAQYEKSLYGPPSGPHSYGEEFLVQPVNHGVERRTPSGNESTVGVVKDLTDPFKAMSTTTIQVQTHPKTLLDTARGESGKLGSGDAVEGGGISHEVPQKSDRLHVDYLRRLLERIRLDTEWDRNLAHQKDTDRLKGSGYEMLAHSKKAWQLDAVWDFVKRFNKALG